MTPELMTYAIAGLAFVAIAGLGLTFAGGTGRGKQSKRLKAISDGTTRRGGGAEAANAARRKQMDATTKALRDREEANRKKQVGKSIEDRIKQSGMNITVPVFWIASAISGVVTFIGLFLFAGFNKDMMLLAAAGTAFAAAFGLPRWFLGFKIAGRQKKFISQFADAIDVIVRGVKSGLPLHECLRMIARESPQPLAAEFQNVCDAIAMGVDVPRL